MFNFKVLVLFTMCFGFSSFAFAVSAADVANYWVSIKYPTCDGLGDLVAMRANQEKLRDLASNECSSIPSSPKNCFAASDKILAEKFDTKAVQQGCDAAKVPTSGASVVTPRKHKMISACNTMALVGPKTIATSDRGSVQICELRTGCNSDFTIYGKDFTEGDYRLTCTVAVGTICSNVNVEGCSHPTIQKIGLIWNDDTINLNEAAGVQ